MCLKVPALLGWFCNINILVYDIIIESNSEGTNNGDKN